MTKRIVNITDNASLEEFQNYQRHEKNIKGHFEIGGNFGGGTLTLFISFSDGTVKNPWGDLTGVDFSTTQGVTRGFELPASKDKVRLYYTLTGATSPNMTITILDNT